MAGNNSEPYAYRYVQGLAVSVYRGFAESLPETFGSLERLFQRGFRQSNDEFFPRRNPGEYVNSSQSRAADCGHHLESWSPTAYRMYH